MYGNFKKEKTTPPGKPIPIISYFCGLHGQGGHPTPGTESSENKPRTRQKTHWMNASILTIGDEILMGQITDTNSARIARELTAYGIEIKQTQSIGDQASAIFQALDSLLACSGLVIVTGGLGPTKDDLTKHSLCEYFDDTLVFHDQTYRHIEKLLARRNVPMNPLNRDQALLPAKAEILPNRKGTAAGMWFSKDGKSVISLPGVPFEMECILEEEVLPRIARRFPLGNLDFRMLFVYNVAESALAGKLEAFEAQLPEGIRLAYLPSPGLVKLRLTAKGSGLQELPNQTQKLEEELKKNRFSYMVPQESSDSLAAQIGRLLREKGQTLSTAESCTGGYLAHLITAVPGSSDYYKGSVIAYGNEIKEKLLHVPHTILEQQGAVSEECVKAMASSVRQQSGTDFALATSGIAGPGGGTESKPVGTVWMALAGPDSCQAKLFHFSSDRERNIERASLQALGMLFTALKDGLS